MHSHTCTLVGVARPRRDLSLLSWVLATQVFFLFSSFQFNILPLMICRLRLNLPPRWVGWVGWNDLESLHTVVLNDPFFGFPHGPTLRHVQMGFPSPLTLRTLFLRVGGELPFIMLYSQRTFEQGSLWQSFWAISFFFLTLGSFLVFGFCPPGFQDFAGISGRSLPFLLSNSFFPASRNLENYSSILERHNLLMASKPSLVDNLTH